MYPSNSLSLDSVNGICKSLKLALTDSDNETLADYLSRFSNVLDYTTGLASMRQTSLELASQPIYKYICYNCVDCALTVKGTITYS